MVVLMSEGTPDKGKSHLSSPRESLVDRTIVPDEGCHRSRSMNFFPTLKMMHAFFSISVAWPQIVLFRKSLSNRTLSEVVSVPESRLVAFYISQKKYFYLLM